MGTYGYDRNTTPNIDKLAEDSYVFTRAFSQSEHTMPSLYSTFSSTYPVEHGIFPGGMSENGHGSESIGSNNFTMLAEILDRQGYHTFSVNGGANVRGELGFERGFDSYHEAIGSQGSYMSKEERYDYIREKMRSNENKFFLFYQSFRTHDPYFISDNYTQLFGPSLPGFRNESQEVWTETAMETQGDRLYSKYREYYFDEAANNSTVRRFIESQYDGSIRRSDDFIGGLIELLKEEGEYENTIIVVNSQHGEAFYEHGRPLHDTLYNEIIRVPLIVHLPRQTQQKKTDQYVANVDLAPTLIDLTGNENELSEEVKKQWRGTSLVPALRGDEIDKEFILAEGSYKKKAFIDISSGIKYYNSTSGDEFYDLNRDFEEQNPLQDSNLTSKAKERFIEVHKSIRSQSDAIGAVWPYFG